jgi:hypothetical protein
MPERRSADDEITMHDVEVECCTCSFAALAEGQGDSNAHLQCSYIHVGGGRQSHVDVGRLRGGAISGANWGAGYIGEGRRRRHAN